MKHCEGNLNRFATGSGKDNWTSGTRDKMLPSLEPAQLFIPLDTASHRFSIKKRRRDFNARSATPPL